MTVEWFDLGLRLRAAAEGRVMPRLRHAPFADPFLPIAVRASTTSATITATITVPGSAPVTAVGGDAILSLLDRSGVTFAGRLPLTLVIEDAATLPALVALARHVEPGDAHAAIAAHIGWWAGRADYPGTAAVLNLPAACRAMWVTGAPPAAEKNMAEWRRWLGIGDDTPVGMLATLDRLTNPGSLPLLAELRLDDLHDWLRASNNVVDGYDWRSPDHVGRAAVGLAARCAATEVYGAALLDDPLWRRRAVHTGHVVTGRLVAFADGKATIECPRLDARLRTEAKFVGWAGKAGYVPRHRFNGTITASATAGQTLLLHVKTGRSQLPSVGAVVTLMPEPPRGHSIGPAIYRYVSLYSTRTSWLTTGQTPTPYRRDVPLEVLVAAAEQE